MQQHLLIPVFIGAIWEFFQLKFPGLDIKIGTLFLAMTLLEVVVSAIKHIFGLEPENNED